MFFIELKLFQNEVVLSYPGRLDVEAVQKDVDDSQRSRENTGASPENSSTFHHFPSEIPFGNLGNTDKKCKFNRQILK